jgi:iron uptake system component EfeO
MRAYLAGAALIASAIALGGCASDNARVLDDAQRDAAAAAATKNLLVDRAHALAAAAAALCAAAPPPSAGGWSAVHDAASLAAMKAAWKDARRAYEGLEGAADAFFPDLDQALDTRYEDALGNGPDPDPLDGHGFVGLHAVERVLWADRIPAGVVAFEASIPGSTPAAFPSTEAEAARFRDGLCARLVEDAGALGHGAEALSLDSRAAYGTAARLVASQLEKLTAAGEGRAASRYAGYGLADLGANLASAKATHAIFHAWLLTRTGGEHVDGEIAAGAARLENEYAAFGSDDLPYVPAGWRAVDPSHDALETPFGQLFVEVRDEADATLDGSLAHSMGEAAALLGVE